MAAAGRVFALIVFLQVGYLCDRYVRLSLFEVHFIKESFISYVDPSSHILLQGPCRGPLRHTERRPARCITCSTRSYAGI